jgi:HEAT repeat protein
MGKSVRGELVMRAIGIVATVAGWLLGLTSFAAENKDQPIIGFPGFHELGRRPAGSGDEAKSSEITAETKVGGRTLAAWIDMLDEKKTQDDSERERAIRMIAMYGTVAREPAADALLKAAGDGDAGVRCKAMIVLTYIGVPEKDKSKLIKKMALRIGDDSQVVGKYYAAVCLLKYLPDFKEATDTELGGLIQQVVIGAHSTQSWEVRTVCLQCLGDLGRMRRMDPNPFNVAINAINDYCADVRIAACETIYTLDPPSEDVRKKQAIEKIETRMRIEKEAEVGIWLSMAMMRLKGFNEQSLSLLSAYMIHNDPHVREQAVTAMGFLRDKARPKIADLISALEDKDATVVYAAIASLANVSAMNDAKVIQALKDVPKKPNDFSKPIAEALKKTADAAIKYVKEGPPKGSGSGKS